MYPADEAPKKKFKWKRLRNRILKFIALYTIPYIYIAYIRFVWWTSKVVVKLENFEKYLAKDKVVAVLWHQDVFCVAWAYREYKPLTMASVGDAGEIIAKILHLSGYTRVWRGGSSKGKKRHVKILDDFIADFRETQNSVAGITVDGSSGPAYHIKHGALVIAQECECPIFLFRIWSKRKILLPTWDRTMIPLPFSKIMVCAHGPYWVPKGISPEEFEKLRLHLENELLEITFGVCQDLDKKVPPACQALFPAGWQPQWTEEKWKEMFLVR